MVQGSGGGPLRDCQLVGRLEAGSGSRWAGPCTEGLVSSLPLFSRQLCVLCQSITQSRDGRIEAQNRRLSKRSDLSCVGSPSSLSLSIYLSPLFSLSLSLSFLYPHTPPLFYILWW